MGNALVVVDRSEQHRGLLEEAAQYARGGDGNLVLLTLMTREEFESGSETLASIGSVEDVSYDGDVVLSAAIEDVREFASETAANDVEFEVLARAVDDGGRAEAVLEVAADRDVDHVFVLGRHRSPTGKALFGDTAQKVALGFDGYVTLATS